MGGFYGVASKSDCVADLFYGTDYHSHLGTVRGGMAVRNGKGFTRFIKDITNSQFRSKFEDDLNKMEGSLGIGVISDYEDQPLIIGSHLGTYALVTVARVQNLDELAAQILQPSAERVPVNLESRLQRLVHGKDDVGTDLRIAVSLGPPTPSAVIVLPRVQFV